MLSLNLKGEEAI